MSLGHSASGACREPRRMGDGGRVGEFPHQIIGDERLPLPVVRDKCVDVALQEIGGDRHRGLLVLLRVTVRSAEKACQHVWPLPHDASVTHTQDTPVAWFTSEVISTLPLTCRRPTVSRRIHPKPQAGGGQVERLVRCHRSDLRGRRRFCLPYPIIHPRR
jgi:hypothetical protein